jgi:hypothetical protein
MVYQAPAIVLEAAACASSAKKIRESESRYLKRSPRCKALLVEAVRVNGQPRQRHIAFLARYQIDAIDRPDIRFLFWQRARSRLDQLGNRISPETRKKIEVTLARHVPL